MAPDAFKARVWLAVHLSDGVRGQHGERIAATATEFVAHGGLPFAELAERGIDPRSVIDFSVSVHPLGPSPRVLEAARTAELGCYPDPEVGALRQALARRHGVATEQVWVGNGASELLWLAAHAALRGGDSALTIGPTYGEYGRAARLAGAVVGEYWSPADREFAPDLDEIELLAELQRPRVVFLCNPNNPTGVYLGRDQVARLAGLADRPLLILDEAFVGFCQEPWDALELLSTNENVLLVRSMTKDHGIPGLRLGYALGSSTLIAQMRHLAPPWSVNAAAQTAGLAALADDAHLEAGRQEVQRIAAYLRPALATFGLTLRPSAANFWLMAVPNAHTLRTALLQHGVLVRDCGSFGLPGYVRIGARPLADCQRLVAALSACLA